MKQIAIFAVYRITMAHEKEWFESWFDTKYYHILYKHRDYNEASLFLEKLVHFLQLSNKAQLLDLACGKGRHSIFLNRLNFNVIGADLSENNIAYAKQFENEGLQFIVHDMRWPFNSKFDCILNLFTSFGFFEDDKEDIQVLKNIKNSLNKNGLAVVDFMNVKKVIANLIPAETIGIDGIDFNITRYVNDNFIVKEINFDADNAHHRYFEKVKCLHLDKINTYLEEAGLKIKNKFGNYNLEPFNEITSERLILVLE